MSLLLSIIATTLFAIWFGILRRWFGGARYFGVKTKRWIQTTIMIITMISEFLLAAAITKTEINHHFVIIVVLLSGYLQAAYWAQKHGSCFDDGRGDKPEGEELVRYESYWYHFIPDYFFKKAMYGYGYDTMLMGIRYTLPVLPLMLLNPHFFWVGFFVTFIYAYSWSLYEIDRPLFPILGNKHISFPTNLAEVLTGMLFGGGLFIFALSVSPKLAELSEHLKDLF